MSSPNPHYSRDYEYTREDAVKMIDSELEKWHSIHTKRAEVLWDQMETTYAEIDKDMSDKRLREEFTDVKAKWRFHIKVANVLVIEIMNRRQ
jgi:hypothetical protein